MAKAPAKSAQTTTPDKLPNTPTASKEDLLRFYREMVLIRRFEERAGQLYGMGLIGGFCHLYIGQEAVAVGVQESVKQGHDKIITGYRDHGHMLAYGIDPNVIMAELTGREAGISKGKGGSMHMFSTEHKFYGGHGIVGAQGDYQNNPESILGYACLDGFTVPRTLMRITTVEARGVETLELLTDGYFRLGETMGLAAWEAAHAVVEAEDPAKVARYRSTKGSIPSRWADDRTYIGVALRSG